MFTKKISFCTLDCDSGDIAGTFLDESASNTSQVLTRQANHCNRLHILWETNSNVSETAETMVLVKDSYHKFHPVYMCPCTN